MQCYNAPMKKLLRYALAVGLLSMNCGAALAERVLLDSTRIAALPIGQPQAIADIRPGHWGYAEFNRKKIARPTQYEIIADADGYALRAVADGGASLFYLRFAEPIDLRDTPLLEFDWRVDAAPRNGPPEDDKRGDDFAFRLYLFAGNQLHSKTLNLVRARDKAVGATWPSPYRRYNNPLHQVRMRAFANANASNGVWRRETIDVDKTWREIFTGQPLVDGIGLMTDSDNAGGKMIAQFRLIKLTARDVAQ